MRKTDFENKEVYAVYVKGMDAPRKKYTDLGVAEVEAIRLTALMRKEAYVVRLVSMFKAPSDAEIADRKRQAKDIENKLARKLANNNIK